MAVVQISRIQQRRGKKYSETSLPQLASGELAWCVDSQELYIGNGAVSEGAPTVGNTKILTQKDIEQKGDLLNIFQRTYRSEDPSIITGVDANHPTWRTIQERLDDRVTTRDFGVVGDGFTDDTIALQRAINQLFLNVNGTAVNHASARVTLFIPAGTYKITKTLLIPSYATIIGEGAEKTIIEYTGDAPVIRCINDTTTMPGMGSALIDDNLDGNFVNDLYDAQYASQPRFINISGLSLTTTSINQSVLMLETVRDSIFSNLVIRGGVGSLFVPSFNPNSIGIALHAFTSLVTCERNVFSNISISDCTYAVYSNQDIINNTFEQLYISSTYVGFMFGLSTDGISVGEQYGPRDNFISNIKFYHIQKQAVFIQVGSGNIVDSIMLSNVGNNGDGNAMAVYPQIYFSSYGNTCKNIKSDRHAALSIPLLSTPYIPEVSGHGVIDFNHTNRLPLAYTDSYTSLFRLPVSISASGEPSGVINYAISYFYNSATVYRYGNIKIIVNVDNGTAQLSDDYNFTGAGSVEDQLKLDFQVSLLKYDGSLFVNSLGQHPYTISINYINPLASDAGYFNYTYTTIL